MKQPASAQVNKDLLLYGPINKVPNCYFNNIDEIMVQRAAPLKKGSGGPSHVESDHFRHILLSKKFKGQAKSLREQIALLARTLALTFVDHHLIDSFTACRLIPLIKKLGCKTYRHW